MRLRFIPILVLILVILVSPSVYAVSWQTQEETGSWEYNSYDHWKSEFNDLNATLVFNATVDNLIMWDFQTELTGDSGYAQHEREITKFLAGDDGIRIVTEISRDFFNIWGIHYTFYWIENDTFSEFMPFHADTHPRFSSEPIDITFYRNTGDDLVLSIQTSFGKWSNNFSVSDFNFTLYNDNWKVEQWGLNGQVEGFYRDENIVTGTSGIEDPTPEWVWYQGIINAINNMWVTVFDNLPDWMQNGITTLYDVFGFLWILIQATVQFIIGIMPYAGAIYAVYWLSLVFRCMKEGTVEPILDHVFKIISVFSAVISAIRAVLPIP